VNRRVLLLDGVLVAVLVGLVLVLSPGLAVVAIIALLVLFVCGASLAAGRARAGWLRRRRRRA